MNFKSNITEIKNNLLKLENKRINTKGTKTNTYHKGVYCISQFEYRDQYKIGLARGNSGLYQRIKSYAIAYPYSDELFVHFMVICLSTTDAEQFERIVLADKGLSQIEQNPTKGSLEWRINSKFNNIQDSIRQACIDHPNLWQKIIVFGKNGWKVIHNDLTKKYTRSSFELEKPGDDWTEKRNIYGTTEIIQPPATRTRKQKKIVEVVPLKAIEKPQGTFNDYTENLAGKDILFKWDGVKASDPRGWYKGSIIKKKTTKIEKSKGFNYNVKYTKKGTNGEIVGTVATMLTKANYGKKRRLFKK
jgi:hypothetical protein